MADSDPYRAYNFKLEIQGVTQGHFTRCSGLGVDVEVIRYREAGNNQVVRAIPGKTTFPDVTLSYGLTESDALWQWLQKSAKGEVERKNASIIMLDPAGTNELLRWNLNDSWPSQWRGAELDAMGQQVAIETLTLAYESLERD